MEKEGNNMRWESEYMFMLNEKAGLSSLIQYEAVTVPKEYNLHWYIDTDKVVWSMNYEVVEVC